MAVYEVKKGGSRLDLFLKQAMQISRKEVKRILDSGLVWVNERKVIIASWEVEKNDRIEVKEEPASISAENYFVKVFYEDDDLIVVEKEAGVPCEESPTSLRPSFPKILETYIRRLHPEFTHAKAIAFHRLDQPTSGLMVYGKKKTSLPLLEDFKTHKLHRRYQALVYGKVEKPEGIIRASLIKIPDAKGAKVRVGEGKEAKPAMTHYRVLQRYQDQTLLEVDLQTGRTHQVRAHLAFIGHPVVGDRMYGNVKSIGGRLCLHASELGFRHPVTQKKLIFRSPLPKDFRRLVDNKISKGT